MTLLDYIKSDCYRYTGRCDYRSLLSLYFHSSLFRWQVAFRLMAHSGGFVSRILWRMNRSKRQLQISYKMKMGYGLYIAHGGPIIISPTAEIGNNCNLSQFTTIGANEGSAAVIGDNVYVGPNVCVVENVRIGSNCTIGAGSVVVKDIPDNATAAGNYAKVLNYRNPGRYILNAWPPER